VTLTDADLLNILAELPTARTLAQVAQATHLALPTVHRKLGRADHHRQPCATRLRAQPGAGRPLMAQNQEFTAWFCATRAMR
jgi:hypothetical protein